MPNISLPAAASQLGVTATQMLLLMRNPACPPPTANPGSGIGAITFNQAAITTFAATRDDDRGQDQGMEDHASRAGAR
jgi:hypothetical protein